MAKLASENGVVVGEGDVVVSNGAKQAIWQALLATVSPGDDVLIPAPYWVSYPEMVRLAGANPVILPTTPGDGFLLTPSALAAALTPRSRVLILCTPSNPSGAVYSKAQLEALAAVVAGHDRLLVLSDEIYEQLTYDIPHVSVAALPGMMDRTVTVNGFSKSHSMTGYRIGYRCVLRGIAAQRGGLLCAPIEFPHMQGLYTICSTHPAPLSDPPPLPC